MKKYDESYVEEILAAMPRGLTLEEFMARCRPDINGGCKHEVIEAGRRYFKRKVA